MWPFSKRVFSQQELIAFNKLDAMMDSVKEEQVRLEGRPKYAISPHFLESGMFMTRDFLKHNKKGDHALKEMRRAIGEVSEVFIDSFEQARKAIKKKSGKKLMTKLTEIQTALQEKWDEEIKAQWIKDLGSYYRKAGRYRRIRLQNSIEESHEYLEEVKHKKDQKEIERMEGLIVAEKEEQKRLLDPSHDELVVDIKMALQFKRIIETVLTDYKTIVTNISEEVKVAA